MAKLFLFCILLVLCWPVAVVALILCPIVWLLLLPFRVAGLAVIGAFELVRAIVLVPVRILQRI